MQIPDIKTRLSIIKVVFPACSKFASRRKREILSGSFQLPFAARQKQPIIHYLWIRKAVMSTGYQIKGTEVTVTNEKYITHTILSLPVAGCDAQGRGNGREGIPGHRGR